MYHSVRISLGDQHTHRFLWRDLKLSVEPEVYIMMVVCFGDRPAGTIATVTMRKTAEMGQERFPMASRSIKESTYVDDLLDNVENMTIAKKMTEDIEEVLKVGSFRVKGWTFSGQSGDQEPGLKVRTKSGETFETLNDIGSPLKGELYREETPGAGSDKTLRDREEIGGRTEDSGEIKEQKVLGLYWDAKEDIFFF